MFAPNSLFSLSPNKDEEEPTCTLSNGYFVEFQNIYQHLNSSIYLNSKITVYENEKKDNIHSRYIKIHMDNSHYWDLQLLGKDQDFNSCFFEKPNTNAGIQIQTKSKMMIDNSGKFPTGTTSVASGQGYGNNSEVKKALERIINNKETEDDIFFS